MHTVSLTLNATAGLRLSERCLFFQGMCISVLGPTLEDLAINVNKNISNISYIFVGRSAGYIGGSLIGGILFDCMNPHLLIGMKRATDKLE